MGLFSRDRKAVEFPEGARWLNTDRPLTLADLEGRIVLLDFWTYCCINCMHVIPDLKRLEERYPHLVVIGVHSAKFTSEKVVDNIRHAVLRYEITHPVLADSDFELWNAYGIRAWPSFVLIDPAGNVAARTSGEGPFAMFDDAIASLTEAFEGTVDTTPFTTDPVADRVYIRRVPEHAGLGVGQSFQHQPHRGIVVGHVHILVPSRPFSADVTKG